MSISFKQTVVHLLDSSMPIPILSHACLTLNDDTEAFITSHLVKLLENMSLSKGRFTEDSSYRTLFHSGSFDFFQTSVNLAHAIFESMKNYSGIPSGDLIVTEFTRDNTPFFGFFKINYQEAFTHLINEDEVGAVNTLIKHKTIFPDSSSKIQEAVLINLATMDLLVIDTLKEKYLKSLLGFTASLTVKEKIKVIEHVIHEAIEEHYDNPIEALSFAKTNLAKSVSSTSAIMLDDVFHDTFGEHEHVVQTCLSKCESFGVEEKIIELPKAESTFKKYTSHKIKTSTGIEIKLPTEMLTNPNIIEFVTNPDGTKSIVLKNIGEVISK